MSSASLSEIFTRALETLDSWMQTLFTMLPNIGVALVIAIATTFVARKASHYARLGLKAKMDNQAAAGLLGRMAGAAVAIGGLFFVLSLLHLDKAVTSILAGVGVASVAIGFALQETASNFIAGLLMAIRRPFSIGDSIRLVSFEGVVKSIELRWTVLRTYDGLMVTIPNRDVLRNPVTNLTSTTERRVDISIGVSYGDELDKVERCLIKAIEQVAHRDEEREVQFIYTSFGDSSINGEIRFWLAQAETANYLSARSQAIVALKTACDENDIAIPFPIRTLDFGATSVGGKSLETQKLQLESAS